MFEQIIGWTGFVLYIVAHARISMFKSTQDTIYYCMNLIAASLLVVSSISHESWQPVLINAFWAVVSFCALYHLKLPNLLITNRYIVLLIGMMFLAGLIGFLGFGNIGLSILAWSSVFAFCLSYWRFAAKKISHEGYFLFSAYAALILLPQLYLDQNWPVFVLEIVWGALSVIGYFKLRFS